MARPAPAQIARDGDFRFTMNRVDAGALAA
jgi:hypothetical protein